MANFSTLTDNFDDNTVNTSVWTSNYGTTAETGGKAQITYSTTYSGWATSGVWTFDTVFAEIVIPSTGTNDMSFGVGSASQASGTEVAFYYVGSSGLLFFANAVGYTEAGAPSVTYSATTHKWLRLSLSGSNVLWDTSPDGTTWTNRRTLAKPSWLPATNCYFYYEGHRSSGTAAGTMDNFNIAPSAGSHITSGTGTMTFTGSGVSTSTHTTAGTGTLTLSGSGVSSGGTGSAVPTSSGTVRGYQLAIDWSGAGTYAGTLENVTSFVDRADITFGWGRSADAPTSLAAPSSEMQFSLRNRDRAWDRYFSPENTSSPITGLIRIGKGVQLQRTVGGTQSTQYSESWSAAGTAGWVASGGGTISRVATPSEDGTGSLQYVPPGAVASVAVLDADRTAIYTLPEGVITASFRVRSSAGWSNIVPGVDWYDASGVFISTSTSGTYSATATVWTTVQAVVSPPSTAAYAVPRLTLTGTPPNTNTFNIDNVTIWHVANDAGKIYVLRRDLLDDYEVDSMSTARTFQGTSMDAWGRSDAGPLSTPVYTGLRTGDAINLILDAIGWPADRRAIDAGATYLRYWWEEGTDPAAAVDKLVNSEGPPAIAYVEAGIFVFRDRHHRIRSTTSNTSQALITHKSPAGPQGPDYKVKKDAFTYNHGLKDLVNSVTFSVDVRNPGEMQEVWTSEDPIAMTVGEVRIFNVQPNDPVIMAVAPSMADGSILADSGSFTATISRTSGQSITVFVTAVTGGTLTRLALNAVPLSITRTVQVTAADTASQAQGVKRWPNDAPWANPYDAQAIATRIIALYATERPRVTFTLVNFNERYLSKMLSLRIGDRVTVQNDVLGVNRDFYIERVEHRISRLQMHEVTFTCVVTEPQQPANVFTFNVAGKGFNDGAFGVDGLDSAGSMFVFDAAGQGFDQGLFAN